MNVRCRIDLMKRFLIILLALMLPLQPLFAATADFAHFTSSQSDQDKTFSHMVDHLDHQAHHHDADGDGDPHEDDSSQSSIHLVDFEHSLNISLLPTARAELVFHQFKGHVPAYTLADYLNPITSPPLKPPYIAL